MLLTSSAPAHQPMAYRPRSIGTKLFWTIGVPGLLLTLGGVGYFWEQADKAVTVSSRGEATALAEWMSSTFALTARGARPTPDQTADSVHRAVRDAMRSDWHLFQHVSSMRIIGRNGVVRWSRDVTEEGKPAPDAARILTHRGPEVYFDGQHAEAVRALGGAECGSCHEGNTEHLGALQLTLDQPDLRERVRGVFGRALLSVLLLFAVVLGLTALSLYLFLNRPIRRLANVMRKAEEGDFLVRADVSSHDEIGTLSAAFNGMLARITAMKADEIDTQRDLERAQAQLSLKAELEQTNAKLQKRVGEQSLLFDVARSLTSTLELRELFGRVTALIGERMGIPLFSIMLVRGEVLEVVDAWPRNAGTEGVTFEIGQGACGRAAQTQIPVYLPDIEADQQVFVPRRGLREMKGSLLAVPMVHNGTVLGVINFERPERNAFPAEEIELLSAVGALAAIATQNAVLHERTVALSVTDPLTGAANRRHLFSRLELEIDRARRYGHPVSALMVDIDHFKNLNDVQGHRTGDLVLRQVCDLLHAAIRKPDTLARYGGEEFMIILPQTGRKEALEVAEKLRRAIAEAPFEEGQSQPLGRISISVGAATLPDDADTLDELIDCTDAALYASKRGGRNLATAYQPGMEEHPGRERGPHAARRRRTGEIPNVG